MAIASSALVRNIEKLRDRSIKRLKKKFIATIEGLISEYKELEELEEEITNQTVSELKEANNFDGLDESWIHGLVQEKIDQELLDGSEDDEQITEMAENISEVMKEEFATQLQAEIDRLKEKQEEGEGEGEGENGDDKEEGNISIPRDARGVMYAARKIGRWIFGDDEDKA